MDRRDFMKLAALSGLAVVTPFAPELNAAEESDELYTTGNFFIAFVASGGWDPTNFCDPKGKASEVDQAYETAAIPKAGEIPYAPLNYSPTFFPKYNSELLVINGIDVIQNGHRACERYTWTGHLTSKQHPTFAAFYAAKKSEGRPLPLGYLSYGAYSNTGDLLPISRLRGTAALAKISKPHAFAADDELPFRSDFAQNAVKQALQERQASRLAALKLPKTKTAMGSMYSAQLSASKLKAIEAHLPEDLDSLSALKKQIAVTLAACKAGICISANISYGGFDTHANHETSQNARLNTYLEGVDYLLELAETLGIRERILLMMSSEFSRTPRLNAGNGKDHWAVGSAMFMGPGIRGNRVIGATDSGQKAQGFDPTTMSAIEDKTFRIRPQHIHKNLRKLTGIFDAPETVKFNLEDEDDIDIDFFS